MAREFDLYAAVRSGISSCVTKGQCENKENKSTHKNEPSRPGNKPEIKCRICGTPHLTYKCWNNPDSKEAPSAEVLSDGGRLMTASSTETNSMQIKGDKGATLVTKVDGATLVTEVEVLVEEIIPVTV